MRKLHMLDRNYSVEKRGIWFSSSLFWLWIANHGGSKQGTFNKDDGLIVVKASNLQNTKTCIEPRTKSFPICYGKPFCLKGSSIRYVMLLREIRQKQ